MSGLNAVADGLARLGVAAARVLRKVVAYVTGMDRRTPLVWVLTGGWVAAIVGDSVSRSVVVGVPTAAIGGLAVLWTARTQVTVVSSELDESTSRFLPALFPNVALSAVLVTALSLVVSAVYVPIAATSGKPYGYLIAAAVFAILSYWVALDLSDLGRRTLAGDVKRAAKALAPRPSFVGVPA